MAGEAGGEAKAIAIIKNGATSGWEETAPKETTHHVAKSLYRDVSNEYSLAHAQQPVSTHRLKLFFGQTFMFLETVASMPTQAARRVKRAPVEEKHFAAPGLLARVMARLRGLSRFSLTGRRGDQSAANGVMSNGLKRSLRGSTAAPPLHGPRHHGKAAQYIYWRS
jgi:hypothetical protein